MTRPPRRRLGPSLALAASVLSPGVALSQPTALPPGAISVAEQPAPYPSFANVPQIPDDVRAPTLWKADVVATRVAGARLARQIARDPWTLSDTAGFAARARAEASPPAPLTTSSQAETEALVKAMQARAIKPPRRR
jgi:hypothetical protein